jgi:hypothetical protein
MNDFELKNVNLNVKFFYYDKKKKKKKKKKNSLSHT